MSACFQPGGNDGAIRDRELIQCAMNGDGVGVGHVAGQRRHLQVADNADAMKENGFGHVAGDDDFRAGNAERIGDRDR